MLRYLAFLFAAVLAAQTSPVTPPRILEANLPVQRIGAHDLIAVSVYDAPELSRSVRVNEDGEFRLPMLTGTIAAGGRYPWELEDLIANALQEEKILVRSGCDRHDCRVPQPPNQRRGRCQPSRSRFRRKRASVSWTPSPAPAGCPRKRGRKCLSPLASGVLPANLSPLSSVFRSTN